MWKNVTIGVLSVTLIFVFLLYRASVKLTAAAVDENSKLQAVTSANPTR